MSPVGFETKISASERPQTYSVDRAATGTGLYVLKFVFLDSKLKDKNSAPNDSKTHPPL